MRKKILFVTNHFRFSNGVASVLRSLIDNINQEEFEIHLLTLYEFDPKFAEPITEKATFHTGFGFYFRGFDKIANIIPLKLLYKLFVKDHYDLEVAFQFGLPTKMLSVSPNPRKICWMHTYDSKMTLRKYYHKFRQIITVARIARDKIKQEGFGNAEYCYNIIDESVISKKLNETVSIHRDSKIRIVTVGRIAPDKAILRQIKCILEIHKQVPNTEFWIIGNGSEFPQIQEFVKKNNMTEYVTLFGAKTNPFKYISKCDLYFCGSLREGYSTACQEAAILGLPVVSTEVDGAAELIEDLGCGAILNNNEKDIIEGMIGILTSEQTIQDWKQIASKNKYKFYKKYRIAKIEKTLKCNL